MQLSFYAIKFIFIQKCGVDQVVLNFGPLNLLLWADLRRMQVKFPVSVGVFIHLGMIMELF